MELSKHDIILIPINSIKIVNPRSRNAKSHKKIKEHINISGLRRPVIVREIKNKKENKEYALICGQGRIESLQELGESMVPALIADVDAETGYIMSLIENIARRAPRAVEALERIKDLKEIGLSDKQIGDRIGYPEHWVNNILFLLERGERRLLSGVESGTLPLYLAVEIARSDSNQIQNILLKAYDNNELKGKKISVVRKILDSRERSGKDTNNHVYATKHGMKKKDIEDVVKIYEKSVQERKEILTKSKIAQEGLIIAKQIMKELIQNQEFVNLLISENLSSIPNIIASENAKE
ncbi:ParB N-terminal domain-containing protein [Budviciaceae bacterium BWR-B9]|uniref:ParB N-terminal domain-containing protein n=1 Tax=Limnobaculum allomyrinae TaxID=2791986 RepID=A0ABS1IW88_9GAMM|nr:MULTISPECIES: plasmid partitioning protein RepB C-terminal domain-containing protein [Limnobaculum]MBK5146018.1 ParB N-terminal domain-containing protein [Limnobaculum allomyrinae]MBV7694059.1 ParB N-terminal domain-containing protein [Limnobaculum sp. M2-1]